MLSIILVDDERSTLDGISFALHKYADRYQIDGMFLSAQKALNYLAEPDVAKATDVVITDVRMPGIDGVELTHILGKTYPHLYTIVLSGHSDYDLVRQCMKNGAADYLLKPYSVGTFMQLLDCAAALKAEREMADRVVLLEQSLRSNPEYNEALDVLMRSESSLFAAVLAGLNPAQSDPGEAVKILLRDDSGAPGLALRSEGLLYVIANGYKREVQFLTALDMLYDELHDAHPDLVALSAFDATLPAAQRYARLNACRRSATIALFNGMCGVLPAAKWQSFPEHPGTHLEEQGTEADLLAAQLLRGDRDAFLRHLKKYTSQLRAKEPMLDPALTKKQVLRMLLALDQRLAQGAPSSWPRFRGDYIRHVQTAGTRELLAQRLDDFAQSAVETAPAQQPIPRYIHEAVTFIRKNYMNDIRLNDVAEHAYLNEWYLSTQFKKYCGMTFKEYLNHIRMEAAKELLRQPDLKLWQICEMVGMRDATYFTNVFKKYASMSPREYQRLFLSTGTAHDDGEGPPRA